MMRGEEASAILRIFDVQHAFAWVPTTLPLLTGAAVPTTGWTVTIRRETHHNKAIDELYRSRGGISTRISIRLTVQSLAEA